MIVGLDLQLHSKVTGGGTIASTAGRASFQLSAQYEGSSLVPSGETTFDAAGLSFESTGVAWLVAEVDGSAAQYGGTGSVNGDAGYRFLVAVTDGPDRLRVKIWNVETGDVVFDNQPDDPDDAAASQPIRSGQIMVHGG